MKKMLAILLTLAIVLAAIPFAVIPVSAATSGTTGKCTWTLDGTTLVISGNSFMGNYGYSFNAPEAPWGTDIKTVIIEEGVTSIGAYAFQGCKNLTSVTIPESVNYIATGAFYGCSSLENVYITDFDAWLKIAFDDEFANPIRVADNFYINGELLTEVVVPDGVESINPYVFYGYSNLKNVTIADSVKSIGGYAFYGCSNLTSVTIPNGVEILCAAAFRGCSNLANVTIPDSVKTIQGSVFYGCSSIESITIPKNVELIGGSAFYGTAYYNNSNNWQDDVLYIDDALIECKTTKSGDYVINAGTKIIAVYAFLDCSNLTSITIPDSVESICAAAFRSCSSITGITIPNSVKNIGDYAFDYCDNLTSITIPDSVEYMGSAVFQCSGSLVSVTLSNNVKSIERDLFRNCSKLASVIIPDSVKSIGYQAFYGCSSLKSITIPNSVESIDIAAFYGCDNLENVYITDIVAWMKISFANKYANPMCNAENLLLNGEPLTELIIPNGVESINSYAFYSCSNFTSVRISDGVKNIGTSAFYECSKLTDVFYRGDIEEKALINISSENQPLVNANWHYEICSGTTTHIYDDCYDTLCNECGKKREIKHFYEWVVDQAATCVDGVKHEECSACHAKRNENTKIDAIVNHTFTDDNDVECDVCNQDFFIIVFNCNGGTNVAQIRVLQNETVTLSSDYPLKNGYRFVGWAITKNGDIEYYPNSTFAVDKSIILYAQWNKLCTICGGDKEITCVTCNSTGKESYTCGSCDGEGGRYVKTSTCTKCNGSGAICNDCGRGVGRLSKCSYCQSTSQYFCSRCGGSGGTKEWRTCSTCSGAKKLSKTCSACHGATPKKCNSCNSNGEVIRTNVSAPSAPLLESVSSTTVILQTIENGEYSIDGTTWQDSPIFDNLTAGKEYTFYQRYAKTDTTLTSEPGVPLTIIVHNHTYDNSCDTECNICKEIRTITHTYSSDCDTICNICFDKRTTIKNHTFTDGSTTNCNECEYVRILKSIEITSKPTKTEYLENMELLDVSGGKLTLYYNDGTSGEIDITSDMVSGFNNKTVGLQTLTVAYEGFEDIYDIEIVAKSLTSISVTTKPIITTYVESTALAETGMALTLYYNNNTFETVTDGWISEYDFSNVGASTVKVTYGGKTCTYDVTVIAKTLTSIVIESEPYKLEYFEGDTSLDTNGLIIKAYYNNNTSEAITDYTIRGYASTPGIKTITVECQGKTAVFDIIVLLSGDCNGDFDVNTTDLAIMKLFLAGVGELSDTGKLGADLNGDGEVNTTDLASLKLKLAGI